MKPTRGGVFGWSIIGLAAVLVLLFYIVFHGSRQTIMESSYRIRDEASREISERVASFLSKAPEAAQQFQLELNRGLVDGRDLLAIESAQFVLLLSNRDISEVTFTYAVQTGFDVNGNIQLAASPRGQISVMRGTDDRGQERWWSRHVRQEGERFAAESRELESSARFSALPLRREGTTDIPDPTSHPTFMTPTSQNFFGQLLWSDLHWSQLDAQLPATQRRAEVSVQQAITDAEGTPPFARPQQSTPLPFRARLSANCLAISQG
ncbi:MAG TPA: hypothetical protein VNY07_12320 [Chthoniobacterales bacterium]|nr:hypothetical protein [Chthoniobacterales bacterium]